MADQGALVRVNRGDGILIKMYPDKAREFVALHQAEGARLAVTGPRERAAEVIFNPDEFESLVIGALKKSESNDLESMSVAELKLYAEQHDVNINGLRRKADLIEAIEDKRLANEDEDDEEV